MNLNLDRDAARRARLLAGLTQSALAARVGVHPITVTRWESGAIRPRPDMIRRLAAALGLTVADIATVNNQ